jgi:hypothetical protein
MLVHTYRESLISSKVKSDILCATFMHKCDIYSGELKSTSKEATVSAISLLRIDTSTYEATWEVLSNLYDRVLPGGFVYVENYGTYDDCKSAVEKFRKDKRIEDKLFGVGEDAVNVNSRFAVWWQRDIH